MTKQQFSQAYLIAKSDRNLSNCMDDGLIGCALPGFNRIATTIDGVAHLIRYQCQFINGHWNAEELRELQNIARNKFEIIG